MTLRDYLRLRRLAFALRGRARHRHGYSRYCRAVRFFLQRDLHARVKKSLRRKPQCLPDRTPVPLCSGPFCGRFDCYLTEGAGSLSETQNERGQNLFRAHPRRTNFCTSATMRASATGTSGSGRRRSPALCGEQLEELELPGSIVRVGRYCLYNCDHLRKLTFTGQLADWGTRCVYRLSSHLRGSTYNRCVRDFDFEGYAR